MKSLLFAAFFACASLASAVTPGNGPGGVGTTDGHSELALWVKADDLALQDGDPVSKWNDASGNERHLTQNTPLRQPKWIANSLNGKPVLRFSESSFSDITLPSNNNAFTFVVVLKPQNTGTYHNVFERTGLARPMLWIDRQGAYEFNTTSGAIVRASGQTDLVIAVCENTSTGTFPQRLYVNQATLSDYGPNAFTIPSSSTYSFFNRSGNAQFQGDVAEIIVYSTALTEDEIARVGFYLQNKYGLSSEFTSPYRALTGYSQDPAYYGLSAITPNSPVISGPGSGTANFTISPALPNGLILDPATGVISGTPESFSPLTPYTVTAEFSDAPEPSSASLKIAVVPPTLMEYSRNSAVFTRTRAISPLTPVMVGGSASSFSISPALPDGLSLDPQTGVISGTPAAAASSAIYTVTAHVDDSPSTSCEITLEVLEMSTTVAISELMSGNATVLVDGNGEYSDWIELHNYGTVAIDLAGWSLTDTVDKPQLGLLPSVIIPPGGYLLIFASGVNGVDPDGNIHVAFKLGAEGEYLALVRPDGTIEQSFDPFPPLAKDQSYGTSDGTNYGVYTSSTPGAANGFLYSSTVTITASPEGKTFSGSLNVTLNAELPEGAVIRYTLDNTPPTENSPIYDGSLVLTANARLRARVFEPGLNPGPELTDVYLKLGSDLTSFSSNLPLLFLNTQGSIAPRSSETLTPTSVIALEPGEDGRTTGLGQPHYVGRGGLRIRGRSSQNFPQKQFKFDTWAGDEVKLKVPLFGLPSDSKWVLYAPWSDKAMIRNALTYSTWAKLGRPSLKFRFAEVFINNGAQTEFTYAQHYAGVYMLVERPDLRRLKMENPENSKNLTEITGGFITEHGGSDSKDFTTAGSTRAVAHIWTDPDVDDITSTQAQWIKDYITAMELALYSPSFVHPTTGLHYSAYTDVSSQVDYKIIREWSRNFDGGSTYSHLPRGGKLIMGPLWDYNWAYGNVNYAEGGDLPGYRTDGWNRSFTANVNGWAPYWERFMEDPDFKQAVIDRWAVLRDGLLSDSSVEQSIDELTVPLAQEAAGRNFVRWPQLGIFTAVSAPGYETRTTYQSEVDYLKNFLQQRSAWIDSQFLARPSASIEPGSIAPGSNLQLNSAEGTTIYYTTNGTDPRLAGGQVNSAASSVSTGTSLPLEGAVTIFARAFKDNQWSAPFQGSYVIGVDPTPANLVLTRLNYNPPEPTAQELLTDSTLTGSDFEFLELRNVGTEPVNLSGLIFTKGITFSFPEATLLEPGASIAVVKNPAAFKLRYGSDVAHIGPYEGKLDNDGETIVLATAGGDEILRFTYGNDWSPAANGRGYVLVLHDPSTAPADYSNPSVWGIAAPEDGLILTHEFTSWRQEGFAQTDLSDPAKSGPNACPAGDGVSNFMKFALGAAPYEAANLPQVGLDETGEHLTLTFTRPRRIYNVIYTVESSTDLKTWAPVEIAFDTVSQTADDTTLRVSVPRDQNAKLFLRLVVREAE